MGQFKIKLKAIVKRDNKFLLVKKWYDDRILEPYQWEFLDGEMNFGERLDEAVERIVQEQTQLTVTNGTPYYTWSYVVGDTCYVGICYLFETMTNEVFISEDLVDYAWVARQPPGPWGNPRWRGSFPGPRRWRRHPPDRCPGRACRWAHPCPSTGR